MTRVVSGAVLIVLAVAIVWAAPDWLFFSAAMLVVILGARELATLARASALAVVDVPALVAAALTMAGLGAPGINGRMIEVALMAALTQGRDWAPIKYGAAYPAQLCFTAERSDAGRYFWGAYQLLGGLHSANRFLLHNFWRQQLAKFGATDQRPALKVRPRAQPTRIEVLNA